MDFKALQANYSPIDFATGAMVKPTAGAPAKKKKGFLLDQISTAGGILGGIGGSFIAPVAGTAAGAAAGSALGETLENALTGDALGNNVLKEGALGGIFGAGPMKLLRGGAGLVSGAGRAGIKTAVAEGGEQVLKNSFSGRAVDLGNKALSSQYGTVSRRVADATNPEKTIGELAKLGITKPIDAERMANAITGSDGIITKKVAEAVGKSGKVNVSGLDAFTKSASAGVGLVDADEKSVRAIVNAKIGSLGGDEADPNKVMSVMRDLEARIADLKGKGLNNKLTDPKRLDQAQVLREVRDELRDRLFVGAGANSNVASVLTPAMRNELIKLMPKNKAWANYVDTTLMKSPGVTELRSSMAPFVNISKIIDEGDINSMTFGGRVSNFFNGNGSLSGMLAGSAVNLAKNPTARLVGTSLRAAGGEDAAMAAGKAAIAGRIGAPAAFSGIKNMLQPGQASAQGLEGALLPPQSVGPNMATQSPSSTVNPNMPNPMSMSVPNMGTSYPNSQQMSSGNPYTKENLLADMQRDPKNAKEYMATYQQLEEIFNPERDPADMGYTKPTAAQYSQGITGMQAVNSIEQMYGQDPSLANKSAIPGQGLPVIGGLISRGAGTNTYRGASNNILNAIARINTGANMPESERQFYEMTYLPQPGDDPATIQYKLNSLRQFFQPITNYQGGGNSLEDTLTQGAMY